MEKIRANSDTRLSVKPQAQDANRVPASVSTTAAPTTAASRRPSARKTRATTQAVANSSFWISASRLVVGRHAVVAALDHLDPVRE